MYLVKYMLCVIYILVGKHICQGPVEYSGKIIGSRVILPVFVSQIYLYLFGFQYILQVNTHLGKIFTLIQHSMKAEKINKRPFSSSEMLTFSEKHYRPHFNSPAFYLGLIGYNLIYCHT